MTYVFNQPPNRTPLQPIRNERPFKSSPEAMELKGDVGTNRNGTSPTLVTWKWPCTCGSSKRF